MSNYYKLRNRQFKMAVVKPDLNDILSFEYQHTPFACLTTNSSAIKMKN